ncbi:MAG: FIST C-terminal domain-containing protein [Gammaproteobacteria bacterium]|nr:FIST C-terminal domain-containing protein [Gammaproteobacteria bacterium]
MDRFISAHAQDSDWHVALGQCLACAAPIPEGFNLGFVYCSDLFAAVSGEIVRQLKSDTGIAHWVGSVGVGICAAGREYHSEPAIALLLCQLPPASFTVFSTNADNQDACFRQCRQELQQRPTPFAIVHGNPALETVPDVIVGLSKLMGDGFLVGGLASSRGDYALIADAPTQDALSGVMFSDEVAISTRLTQGCSPMGERHVITSCEENLIITLDDRPAFEVLKQEAGEILANNPQRMAGYIFAGLPIRGSDTGDYLVRHLVGIDPNMGIIAIAERVTAGNSMIFCRRDPQTAYADLLRMLNAIKPGKKPRGALYFSCTGRGQNQFGPDSRELKTIMEVLGDIPLAGFFCNGEISNNRLYGYTGVLTLFL